MQSDSPTQWHLMAKSSRGRARLRALPGVDPSRVTDLAHWTACPLGEAMGDFVATITKALGEDIDLPAFTIHWDRFVSTGGLLMLKSSRPPKQVAKLRRHLRKRLGPVGIALPDTFSQPHVTLNYACGEPAFERAIEPIPWLIDELILVESVTGRKRHVPHARFGISPRQGSLFPLT